MNHSLKEFIEETYDFWEKRKQKYYYASDNKYVFLIRNGESTCIVKGIPDIARISNKRIYNKYEDFVLYVHIEVDIIDKESRWNGEVCVSLKDPNIRNANISDEDIMELMPRLYSEKHIVNKTELGLLLKRYILWALKDYVERRPFLFAQCGWVWRENGLEYECEYVSVTKRGPEKLLYVPNMIAESSYRDHKKGKNIEELIGDRNDYLEFFEFLKSHESLLAIFAYTLHSVLWDYIYRYSTNYNDAWLDNLENKDMLFFSVCLYGQDVRKANVIANILSNLFGELTTCWIRIPLNPHISATSANTRVEKLNRYNSVPIIVTAPSGKVTRASKVFKELNRYRNKGDLFVYPVYINSVPINCDEVVNFDVDAITLPFACTDNEKAIKVHGQMGKLLYCFMAYLQENAKKEYKEMEKGFSSKDAERMKGGMTIKEIDAVWERYKGIHSPKFFSEVIEFIQEKYDYDELCIYNSLPICVLYAALRYFCAFLDDHGIEQMDLLNLYEESFFQTKHAVSDGRDQGKNKIDHQKYLQCLKRFIDKSMEQGEEWVKVDCLPRGNKEECYYLQHKVWFGKFSEYMENVGLPTIARGNIVAILKNNGLLKTGNNNSIQVLREGTYYTVIYAAAFQSLIQSWNLEE